MGLLSALSQPSVALPFPGKMVTPPQAALYMALGMVHAQSRPRVAVDSRGWDCNDYAYQNAQALKADGRTPYYVDVQDEQGQGHMIVAYPTKDGTIYARDPRLPEDVPFADLLQRGYKPIASSDMAAQKWTAWVPPSQ